ERIRAAHILLQTRACLPIGELEVDALEQGDILLVATCLYNAAPVIFGDPARHIVTGAAACDQQPPARRFAPLMDPLLVKLPAARRGVYACLAHASQSFLDSRAVDKMRRPRSTAR